MARMAPAYGAPIETSDRGNTGVKTFTQDQTSESLEVPLLTSRGSFVLDGNTVRDTRFFDAVGGHNILVGEVLEFANSSTFMQARVLNLVSDNIEIDTPFNHSYGGGDTVIRSSDDMRVDGSATPVVFSVLPLPEQAGDMTRYIITIESTANTMDFTQFGSLPALTNGCVLRVRRANGDFRNLFNFKTNGEFIEKSFDHNFQTKSGGGGSGFVARSTYAGPSKRGVAIRLDGSLGEELQCLVQDKLDVGLLKFRIGAQGHELQGM